MEFLTLLLQKISIFLQDPETLNVFVSNRFLMILLVIILLKMKYTTYSSMYLSAIVNIPGTFLHEMSHFLVGFFLNAYPTSFNLLPKKEGDNYVMGSVGFRNVRFYNAVPAALAPMFLLVVGYHFNQWFFSNIKITYVSYISYVLLQTIIIENAVPSSTDFKVAFSNPLSVLMYGFIFTFAVIYIF